MSRRETALPRSVWPLLGLLLLAVLWLWRGGGDEGDGSRRLFDFESGIASCTLSGGEGHIALDRDPAAPGGWRLGGALPDHADAEGTAALLSTLATITGTATVAGAGWTASTEDYGLDGGGLFELLVTAADGERRTLRVGARNPATGLFYATGAGRDGLFMVGEDLVGVLAELPASVRARDLWPGFARDAADTVRLRFPGHAGWDLAARDAAGRWWLRAPADGWARTGDAAAGYHRRHDDRRKREADVDWYRLRDRELRNLLAHLADARVRDFLDPALPAPADGFAVRVDGDAAHEALFGVMESESRLRAWRDGFAAGVVIPAVVARDCSGGLPLYLHTDVLTRTLAEADSFALERADLGRVAFVHGGGDWVLSAAPGPRDRSRLELMGRDLAFQIDRLPIRRVLDSTDADPANACPLGPPLTTLTVWRTGPGAPPRTETRFGLHAATGTPAAWFPADGRLVTIDRDVLVTFQTVLMTAAGMRR